MSATVRPTEPSAVPEWWNIAMVMQDMSRTLPSDWDQGSEFWLDAVQTLADMAAALNGRVPDEQVATLIGAGGLMIAQAVRQTEANDLTAALFARIGSGGAA